MISSTKISNFIYNVIINYETKKVFPYYYILFPLKRGKNIYLINLKKLI